MKFVWCLMISVLFFWLAVYAYRSEPHSEVLKNEPKLSETKPVDLWIDHEKNMDWQTIATFDSQRVAYDPAIGHDEMRRAMIDRGKLPNPYKRSHNFD